MESLPVGLTANPVDTSSLSGASSVLGKEDFLQLLVTQLSHQDPLNPLEGQEFAAQLAQFSSVEALLNIESALHLGTELNSLLAQSMNSGVAAGLIGQTVTARSDQIYWGGDGDAFLAFQLGSPATSTTIEIKNESGLVVRTLELGTQDEGENAFAWDGLTDSGEVAPAGAYQFEVRAKDLNGDDISVTTFAKGTVDRVSFTSEGILLWIGDISISMSDVTSVSNRQE